MLSRRLFVAALWRSPALRPAARRRRSPPSAVARCASASIAPSPNRASRRASSMPSAPTPASPCCSFPGPALAVLEAARNGEVDAALANAPGAEEALEKQGLVHDRRRSRRASSSWSGRRPPDRAQARAAARTKRRRGARARCAPQAATDPASFVFLSANDGSGVHVAEQALWRAARIEPVAPWYVAAEPGRPFTAQVRARGAYALVERGAWTAAGGAPLVGPRRGRPAARRIGPRDALVPRQPSGRQDLHRLDRRRSRAARSSPGTPATRRR